MSNFKYCPRCKQTKDVCEFSSNKARLTSGRDGLASYCKQCVREYGKQKQYDKARWANNKEKEQQRHRSFIERNREEQLARYRENARQYRKSNPDRVNATNRARGKWNYVPTWANKKAMQVLYSKAKEWSVILGEPMEVDHIVPLRGRLVCGLHCEANLQLLAKTINHQKRHFVWPDMPE